MNEVDLKKVSPMMRQYIEVKKDNPDVLIFFRIGDFYEMFFDDALLASHELELTLTGKNAGLDERIPMCGVPHQSVNIYLSKLVEKGYKVGICEQLEDPRYTKDLVKRGLIQIVTRGTITSPESLKANENNYIGALVDFKHAYSLAYLDLSTGDVYAELIDHDNTKVISEVIGNDITELVVNNKIDPVITNLLNHDYNITISYQNEDLELNDYKYVYEDVSDVRYISVLSMLINYLKSTQMREMSHLKKVVIKNTHEYMHMDLHTKENLELTETIRDKNREYSLLWLMDKTKTAMGSRYLKRAIEEPLVNENDINKRLDVVTTLLKEFIAKDEISKYLYEIYDLERLSGRIAFGSANARDLLQLKTSLAVIPDLNKELEKIGYPVFDDFKDLHDLLEKSIYSDPPITITDGYLIKDGYNKELDELKSLRKGGKEFVTQFELEEQKRTGIKLKVGYNHVFGYYIEVPKGQIKDVKEEYHYERRQTLANCERYISPILKEKESLILNAEEKIIDMEYKLFCEVRDETKKYIHALQETSTKISELDMLVSFATIAEENNYVRPTFNNKHNIDVVNGRHPVVEKVSKDHFIANDVHMDNKTDILLITGPNMAGKSTYMREMGLISVMAQVGSFVPAKKADLPIFDSIYTRIGASDNLVSGESTFMVEMTEANYAISNATENSLILFDELGRGTATFDGMALAQSIIEYISKNVHAKTMFSTHYHELTDLDKTLSDLHNVYVSAKEEEGNITFLHKVEEGSIDKSYGIHVAKLAELPDAVINRADEILKVYEAKEKKRDLKVQESLPLNFDTPVSKIEEEIKSINPLEITPLEALNILYKLKEETKK